MDGMVLTAGRPVVAGDGGAAWQDGGFGMDDRSQQQLATRRRRPAILGVGCLCLLGTMGMPVAPVVVN